MNQKICVEGHMFYDCKATNATVATAATTGTTGDMTPALPAFPSGPEECDKCFMVGGQVGCAHCKDATMYVDSKTGMCMHKDMKNDTDHHMPMPEIKTNVAQCPSEMMGSCKVCHEGHFDNNGTQEFVRKCLLCREGFIMGSKGNCYSEQDHSAGE
jgi:hypothetical protein